VETPQVGPAMRPIRSRGQITIADLPPQWRWRAKRCASGGLEDRVDFLAFDALDDTQPFPEGYDAMWNESVPGLLFRNHKSCRSCPARRRPCPRPVSCGSSNFCGPQRMNSRLLSATDFSLFCCYRHGHSRMYTQADLLRCVRKAASRSRARDQVGLYHTLLKCRR